MEVITRTKVAAESNQVTLICTLAKKYRRNDSMSLYRNLASA